MEPVVNCGESSFHEFRWGRHYKNDHWVVEPYSDIGGSVKIAASRESSKLQPLSYLGASLRNSCTQPTNRGAINYINHGITSSDYQIVHK
jgi:hypothetical protein